MGKLNIDTVVVGFLQTNCYFVSDSDTKECVIIDPGDNPKTLIRFIEEHGFIPQMILITHPHSDHTGAVKKLMDAFPVTEKGYTTDGEELNLLGRMWKVIYTPGHHEQSCCFYIPEENVLFSGDTLFYLTYGRTDLETGSLTDLIHSINDVLFKLPDETKVLPGHGPATIIETEKKLNPISKESK